MTPLQASLIFVIIAVLVSLFRHFFFQSSSLNAGDDTNISLTKLHTLTIHQQQYSRLPYNSLYEAYFRPQEKKEQPASLPYNSYVLKKAILNNEGVYICNQNFAAIFQEKTSCDGPDGICKWKTTISVYRLPFLKKQQEKILEIQGRVLQNEGSNKELKCRKKQLSQWEHHYQLNFVVLHRNKQSKKGSGWTMNSLIIEDESFGWKKNSSFTIKMMKWNLKNVYHYPLIYSFDEKCLSYVTQQQPWLIHFNCGMNWSSFNILHSKIQSTLFSKANFTLFQPPFSSTHHVNPFFMQLFKSSIKIYTKPQSCTGACPRQQTKDEKMFISYIFQIANSPLKYGNTVFQLTIAINTNGEQKQNEGLVSYNILSNDLDPQRKLNIDCSINSKEYKLIRGLYTYQLGEQQGEDHTVAAIDRHSLICVCSYNFIEVLRVIEIDDLLGNFNSSDIPTELLVRSQQNLQQMRLENAVLKRQRSNRDIIKQEEDEQSSWFSFDIFDLEFYNDQDVSQIEPIVALDSETQQDFLSNAEFLEAEKKRKMRQKSKRDDKKRSKKVKKQKKIDLKFSEDLVGDKLAELSQNFDYLGLQKPKQAQIHLIQIPMPFLLTSDSKIKIINGDFQFPLIYIETSKKYLLTYQLRQDDESQNYKVAKNQYVYKYSQIGASIKSPENYIRLFQNETNKTLKRKQEYQMDRFLLQIINHNSDVLNQIKSIVVVDAKYDQFSPRLYKLKGLTKPYRKNIIVAWGWGIQVYEMNWDKKNLRNQLSEIQEQLNSQSQGIQMLTILPFIELFATVYCLFQTLITTR